MLREYLMGEAMHGLGIPTTRALAVVAPGERVLREEGALPGAVLCRIRVDKVGRSSMEHTVEIWDVGAQAEPLLAGRGRVRHVWIERAVRQSPAVQAAR
jgi:hypothetical protein